MILIGLGANLTGPWGNPRAAVEAALLRLNTGGMTLIRASDLIETPPFGRPNQPNFVNAVAIIATHLGPDNLMRRLHAIEHEAGRRRGIRWGPRTLDLDLLDYHGVIRNRSFPLAGGRRPLILPHPGISERRFVLQPIAAIAPRWRHPLTRETALRMLRWLR